jgi:hypothetical protein
MARRQGKLVRAGLLSAVLLAGCADHGMTASEATEAANAELNRTLPQFDRSSRTIRTDEEDGKWHVYYESADDVIAGGPVIVDVDKRTRHAAIVQSPQ